MKLLVDTHVLIWAGLKDAAPPECFRAVLSDPNAEVHVSAVSAWEVATKRALGKPVVPVDLLDQAVASCCLALGLSLAPDVFAVVPDHGHTKG